MPDRTARSSCSLNRLRKSFRRIQARLIKLSVTSVSPHPPYEERIGIKGTGLSGSAYAGPEYRNALGQKGTGQSGVPAGKIFDFSCGFDISAPSPLSRSHPFPRCPGVFRGPRRLSFSVGVQPTPPSKDDTLSRLDPPRSLNMRSTPCRRMIKPLRGKRRGFCHIVM